MSDKTILLVEDNPSDVELTKRALEKGRIANKLVVATDGQEALDYLFGRGEFQGRDTSDTPALTLLDLKLPKVSGLDVLRQIRSNPITHRMPVVIMTTSREEQDRLESFSLGVAGYMLKPVDYSQFVAMLDTIYRYWTLSELPGSSSL